MKRIKCTISYDGTGFSGYQVQPGMRTIQGEIEAALRKIHKGIEVKCTASGRTDAGVHAVGQVLHFDTMLDIPEEKWKKALNALLSDDIAVIDTYIAIPSFHSRFHVLKKEYRYVIDRGASRNIFRRNYSLHYPHQLDFQAIDEVISVLKGTHDFTSFCSAKTEVENKVRTIYEIEYFLNEYKELVFKFLGNGFLYNMVRILMGTILEAGQGRISPEEVRTILQEANREKAGKTVPPQGLYLWKVYYDN